MAKRRRVFAALAALSGAALLAFELRKSPAGTTVGERWFWLVVGVAVLGMGIAELMRPDAPKG